MRKHSTAPFYAIVRALIEQHHYTPRKAFETVWHSRSRAKPRYYTDGQIRSWSNKVKVENIPLVDPSDFKPKPKRY